jgi:hypothetical protein
VYLLIYPALFKGLILLIFITLILAGLTGIVCLIRIKKFKTKKAGDIVKDSLSRRNAPLDREAALRELTRLCDGGEMNVSLIENMSAEERVLFEIVLIDALTKWPRDNQHKLRAALIKYGYDEHCSRRLMKEAISDSVRASTLLSLLRPQSSGTSPETDRYKKTASGKGLTR